MQFMSPSIGDRNYKTREAIRYFIPIKHLSAPCLKSPTLIYSGMGANTVHKQPQQFKHAFPHDSAEFHYYIQIEAMHAGIEQSTHTHILFTVDITRFPI